MIHRYTLNERGTDYAVGDVHGHFTKLQQQLDAIGFNQDVDRLFSVGDLVDRGPECDRVLDWLAKPWFHPVRGNHEDMAIRWPRGNMQPENYLANGGGWNISNPTSLQREIAESLDSLPLAIEVETGAGLVGIVHADCPYGNWNVLKSVHEAGLTKYEREVLLWDRRRITEMDATPVAGLRALIVGHTPVMQHKVLGNVHYIDSGAWHYTERPYLILRLDTLEAVCSR